MTEKKAEPAYIITESELRQIGDAVHEYGIIGAVPLFLKIRSRPHNPAPAIISVEPHPPGKEQLACDNTCPARCPGCEDTCPLWEHDDQVKREALEEVLKELRPHVLLFALSMEWKLRQHDKDRGARGWVGYVNEEEIAFLLKRLKEEVGELEKQIKHTPLKKRFSETWDVGNFAMMLDTSHYSDAEITPKIKEVIAELRKERAP